MKKEETCTAIALYDLDKQAVDLRGLFTFFEAWFLQKGYTPKRGSADGEGIKATKTWTFKYTKKFLEKRNFENIVAFWFAAYPPEWDYDATDGLFSVQVELEDQGFFNLYFHNSIVLFERGLVETLIKDISRYLRAYYGIVYQRDFDKGPGLYAGGVITGLDRGSSLPEIQKERDNIGKWWKKYMLNTGTDGYHLGQLRDIYPMNLLSEAHLKETVFGKSLKEWIESSPEHGELKPLTDILWEWWVPENKIPTVCDELLPSGLIICA